MSLADEIDCVRVCLYGPYGTGKTSALASAAALGDVHIIDTEQRLKAGPLRRLGIDVSRIEPFRDIRFEPIMDELWRIKGLVHDNPGRVAAVGIDTIEDLVKTFIGTIIDESVEVATRRSKARGEVLNIDPLAVPDDGYNIMTEQVRRIFRLLRDLGVHLMFTSHERRDKEDENGRLRIGPSASPAVQADLMGYVDILGHTGYDEGYFVASFRPGTKFAAKDTFGVLPPVMTNPTLARIVAYCQGDLTPDDDPVQQAYERMVKERGESAHKQARATGEREVTGRVPRNRS